MSARSPIDIMIDRATGYDPATAKIRPQRRSLSPTETDIYAKGMIRLCDAAERLRKAYEKGNDLDWHIKNVISKAGDLRRYETKLLTAQTDRKDEG